MARKKNRSEPDEENGRREVVSNLLSRIAKELEGRIPKATLADFIRLAQFERELAENDPPKEIVVTWQESEN